MGENDPIKDISSKLSTNQIGSIARYVEPISCYLPLKQAKDIFDKDHSITSIAVEYQSGVSGLISRKTIYEKSKSIWESLKNSPISEYVEADTHEFNSRENVKKVLNSILQKKRVNFSDDFIIYHDGSYLGLVSFLALINYVSKLQDQELQNAREIQQFLLAELLAKITFLQEAP